jgi:hypothetical protein
MAELRDLAAALAGMPAEAFLDGPPTDGELLLRRTLRQVRAERAARPPQPDNARMSVVLLPVAGEVRVSARIIGAPAGRLCRLVAVTRTGDRRAMGDRFLVANDTTVDRVTGIDLGELATIELTDAADTILAAISLP